MAVVTTEDVAHVPLQRRAAVLQGLFREDLAAQGVVLLTAGMLRTAAPVLALLHVETPVHLPVPVPGRSLFAVYPKEPHKGS